jgi:uncharacterized damage-inducible protein DinB
MNKMTNLRDIEKAIDQLAPHDYEELLRWMDERPQPIDLQLEADLDAGRLDELIDRATADHQAGRTIAF